MNSNAKAGGMFAGALAAAEELGASLLVLLLEFPELSVLRLNSL
jgi:hypothetical protein